MKEKRKKFLKHFALALVISFGVILFLAFLGSKIGLIVTFGREDGPEPEEVGCSTMLTANDYEEIHKEKIEFKSGKNTLKGYIWGNPVSGKLVVISHGLGELSNTYYPEMEYFVKEGYRVLTYDNTGVGESEGLGTKGLSQSVLDLDGALTFIETDPELKSLPVYLFGHSWGGHAVTAALNFEHKNVKAVASIAGYNSNGGAMLEWMQRRMNMGNFAYSLYPFAAFWAMVDAGDNYYMTGVKGINSADVPVIVVQGGNDDTVLNDSIYSHREEITNGKVEYYFIEDGTHTGVLRSQTDDAATYRERVETEYEKLVEKYDGKVPEEELLKFAATIDKQLYNEVNTDTMGKVCRFFKKF